ncbi:hypothetical protein N7495_008164 [Penicillium taxi]|uniref:uncharacterized protein n=1 Tax=Penicillium taxi TaxID=168475 RepID=UPI002545A02F|nr:uncharacterized protein N7495_008164 [Penicillium taxi]KAJ5888123.1 hypothetical protein N7495_008164 [Penicillium taxi]
MTNKPYVLDEPAVLDSVRLHKIELPLPAAPEAWHRLGKSQPCTASLKLSYTSAIAAAAADNVSLSLDYGKLFRRIESDVRDMVHHVSSEEHPHHQMVSVDGTRCDEMNLSAAGQDPRVTASIITNCGLGLLDATAAPLQKLFETKEALLTNYAKCEVSLHLPKALLRSEEGLRYRSVTVWGYMQRQPEVGEPIILAGRVPVVVEEEFAINGIRCHCIVGVNQHERLEKQAVIVSLTFNGPGQLAWASKFVETYQNVTRAVAEKVEETSFQTVESLATFIAHIVTVDFGNERVTVLVEKPSALPFVQRSGVEITRTREFFDTHDVPVPRAV